MVVIAVAVYFLTAPTEAEQEEVRRHTYHYAPGEEEWTAPIGGDRSVRV